MHARDAIWPRPSAHRQALLPVVSGLVLLAAFVHPVAASAGDNGDIAACQAASINSDGSVSPTFVQRSEFVFDRRTRTLRATVTLANTASFSPDGSFREFCTSSTDTYLLVELVEQSATGVRSLRQTEMRNKTNSGGLGNSTTTVASFQVPARERRYGLRQTVVSVPRFDIPRLDPFDASNNYPGPTSRRESLPLTAWLDSNDVKKLGRQTTGVRNPGVRQVRLGSVVDPKATRRLRKRIRVACGSSPDTVSASATYPTIRRPWGVARYRLVSISGEKHARFTLSSVPGSRRVCFAMAYRANTTPAWLKGFKRKYTDPRIAGQRAAINNVVVWLRRR